VNQDHYKNLKEKIIKFANQSSIRTQLREQIDRFCEMVEKRIEIVNPIKEEARKRYSDPKLIKQTTQKQVDKIKEKIDSPQKPQKEILEAINKPFLVDKFSGSMDQLSQLELQAIFWFCVNEWAELQKYYGRKKISPEVNERICLFDRIMDKLPLRCFQSDVIEKEGPPKEGYLFGYECNSFCKEKLEGSGSLYWYPTEPPNPIEWFQGFSVCGGKLKFRGMEPNEEFMVNAVLLASIHDVELKRRNPHSSHFIYRSEPYLGQHFERDMFLRKLWLHFNEPGLKKQTQLELALEYVAENLDKTGGNAGETRTEPGNKSKGYSHPAHYLADVSGQINVLIIGNEKNRKIFCRHISKVIKAAEKYEQYLLDELQKAKKAGLTHYDENKAKDKWTWWVDRTYDGIDGRTVYFANHKIFDAQFYIRGEPKPDPLDYLYSMLWGSVGEVYEGLERLDYQFVLLAIIHDAQNWQAGREQIYFNTLETKTLPDRLCRAVCLYLQSYDNQYSFKDVQGTIDSALRAVEVEQPSKPVNKPSKEAIQAYKLLGAVSSNQTEVAKLMSKILKRPIAQWQISRWNKQCKNFLKANDMKGFASDQKLDIVSVDPSTLDMGPRTDGKRSGDPRNKKKKDPDNASYK